MNKINPSKRKYLFIIQFQHPLGSFYKFARASSNDKAIEIGKKWMKKENFLGYIISCKQINDVEDILKVKGMLLE